MVSEIELIWTFMLAYTKGWGVKRHDHNYFQMYYCLSGEGLFSLNDQEIVLKENDCMIIHPHQPHELFPIANGQMRVVDTKFYIHDEALCQEVLQAPQIMQLTDIRFSKLQQTMRDEWVSHAIHAKDLATLLFLQSLLCYLRQHSHPASELLFYLEIEQKAQKLTGVERRIADYLAEHYWEDVSLDQLSESLRYSKNYLCKVFKTATGITISEYGNFLRIRKAYDLVCNTTEQFSDIATDCGFSSIHYFSKVFRKYVGMPPSQARDRDRNCLNTDIRLHGTFRYRYYDPTVEGTYSD